MLRETQDRIVQILQDIDGQVYCPSCGCDRWNTAGCPFCPIMRRVYEALTDLGGKIRGSRIFPPYEEPSELNLQNMKRGK